jgi:small redox-active disulfide protein 2
MVIKILGTGCPKCKKLEGNAREALKQIGASAEVEKVTDLNAILRYGVMITPGLVIDEVVKVSGTVPSVDQIRRFIKDSS